MAAEWIGAAEAAQRLGVKQASLYSYVSRGVLSSRRAQGSRGSLFSASEVEGLARRGRPRRAPGVSELVIETRLTEITGEHLRYRGLDAIALASERSFEEVAVFLWLPLERLQVIVPALAAADALRLHLDPAAVIAAGRCLIAGMVDCLPAVQLEAAQGGTGSADPAAAIARRLASRLCPSDPGAGLTGAMRAGLVLLADHELAASTLAARVAASVRADPYAVVATGLGAVGGSLHGGASFGAEVMLRAAPGPADAARVVGDLLRRGERIPGFGHFVYSGRDPRAVLLLDLVRRAAPDSERLAVVDAVLAEARRRALPEPNIDFALAALVSVAGMIPGAGEAIFAVARAAGWIAHALEEYARNTPIRPRGIYTGPVAVPR